MLSYIKGIVTAVDVSYAVLECNNVGYEIYASSKCLANLTVGSEVKIYTFLSVREDSITLYGFKDVSEREMFLRLVNVSGIGPKMAIAILSGMDVQALINCIAAQDVASLSGIKGVGKKTAERILLELKGKIKAEANALFGSENISVSYEDEAVLALMALGYSSSEAAQALLHVENRDKLSVEDAVMAALRG